MKLLIMGCGGHGRCCLEIAEAMNHYDEIAFLDDEHVGEVIQGRKVIGKMSDLEVIGEDYDELFIAIGNNRLRKELQTKAETLEFEIATFIHPKSCVSKYAMIGTGSVIFPFACIESNARIGKGTIVCSQSVINHDAVVNHYCLIYANTTIRATAIIKECVKIGSNCSISFGKEIEEEREIKDGEVL